MDLFVNVGIGMPVLFAYGFLILVYLIILKLLLNTLQQIGDRHALQKSIIDRDIHAIMTDQVETSMHAVNVYNIAIIIVKGGVAVLAMAAIIVLAVMKVGVIATLLLLVNVIAVLYAYNVWAKSRQKADSPRGAISQYARILDNIGMILVLSIVLVALLFTMIAVY